MTGTTQNALVGAGNTGHKRNLLDFIQVSQLDIGILAVKYSLIK